MLGVSLIIIAAAIVYMVETYISTYYSPCAGKAHSVRGGSASSKKVNLNPGDLVSLNGEVLIVYGTHTDKKGAVNVEFKTPAKNGRKSASLKKLKIVKATSSIHPAWEKVS